jgi:hypothetical protein
MLHVTLNYTYVAVYPVVNLYVCIVCEKPYPRRLRIVRTKSHGNPGLYSPYIPSCIHLCTYALEAEAPFHYVWYNVLLFNMSGHCVVIFKRRLVYTGVFVIKWCSQAVVIVGGIPIYYLLLTNSICPLCATAGGRLFRVMALALLASELAGGVCFSGDPVRGRCLTL